MFGIPLIFTIAIVITIFEIFLAYYLIIKQNIKPAKALYISIPTVIIIWSVAIISP